MDGNLIEALMGMGSWAAAGLFGIAVCALAGLKKQENIAWEDMGIKNANDEHPRLIAKKKTAQGITYIFYIPDGIDMTKMVERYGDKQGKWFPMIKATFGDWKECEVSVLDGHRLAIKTYRESLKKKYLFEPAWIDASDDLLSIPIGEGRTGQVVMTLGDKLPHIGIAGMTGSGKSTAIRSLLLWLILHHEPVDIYLVDLKEGVELGLFFDCEKVKATAHSIPDAENIIQQIEQEMNDRFHMLYEAGRGVSDIKHYNKTAKNPMRRIMLIIDEFADLEDSKTAIDGLISIARKGRAAGVHMVLCTQRPDSKVMDGQLKANMPGWMCFAVKDGVNSRTILGHNGAEHLRGEGHGLFASPGEEIEFQGYFIDTPECIKLLKHAYIDKPKHAALNTSGWEE